MAPLRNTLVDGDVLFYGSDSFYHMRRVAYTFDHFPHTLWFDSYLDYPHGLRLTWPPLFDQLIAGISLILGTDSPRSVEIIGAIIPPFLGGITIFVLYYLARELFDRRVALLSAFMLAISPQHVSVSCFGRPDHHVLETLLLVGIVLFLMMAFARNERRNAFAIIAGALMAALAYTWIGTPIYLSLFLIYAVAQITLDLHDGKSSNDTLKILTISFATAILLLSPFWNEIWLKPSFFAALGILISMPVLHTSSLIFLKKDVPREVFPLMAAALAYILFIAAYSLDQTQDVYYLFCSGLNYLFGGDLSWKVTEAAPLYAAIKPVSVIGLNLTLAIMGFAYMWHSNIHRTQMLFLVWSLSILALAIIQNRFLYVLSINISILIALFFFRALKIACNAEWAKKNTEASRYIAPTLLALILLPSATSMIPVFMTSPNIIEDNWLEPLQWLKDNSPSTSNFDDPLQVPEYSILTWWDCGNWIVYQAQRPVVANNFQEGAKDAAQFFLSDDEAGSMGILEVRGAKYVITDSEMLNVGLPGIILWTKRDPSMYFQVSEYRDDRAYLTLNYTDKLMNTTLARCHLFDCNGMDGIRLIYESRMKEELNSPAKHVKIFERVPGARIKGRTEDPVHASLNLTSNQGRRFQYSKEALPRDGIYEIVVPYSTENRYGVHSVGRYLVFSGKDIQEIEVVEEDIIQGRTIQVDF